MFKQFAYLILLAITLVVLVSPSKALELEVRDAWSDQVLAAHNAVRARFGASPLRWSQDLYNQTLAYTQRCIYGHSLSSGRMYGENLYASDDLSTSIADVVKFWTESESEEYNYNNEGMSPKTVHFTQVVWKSTTEVGCAVVICPASSIVYGVPSKFFICRYTPPGNVPGQYEANVGQPLWH